MSVNWDDFTPVNPSPNNSVNWDDFTPVETKKKRRPEDEPVPERTVGDVLKDVGVTALKGAVGLPQAFAGLADIVTLGRAGKALEELGYRPEEAQKILDSWYSPAQQAANRNVSEAEGFFGKIDAAIENPSVIAKTVGESIPQMLGGAAIARGLMGVVGAAGGRLAPWVAGGIGEGIMGAGAAASQIRSETEDGLLTPKQAGAAVASGAGTAVLGAAGGKIAQRMGVPDVDTMLATGKLAKSPAGFVKAVVGAGISEGLFEELPQSVQEQMWQNWALDKPLMEGVDQAAALGMLSGLAMGGAGGGYNAVMARQEQPADEPAPPATPPAPVDATGAAASPSTQASPAAAPAAPAASAPAPSPAPAADPTARLAELEILAEQRDLTPAEREEAAKLLATLSQDDALAEAGASPAPAAREVDPIQQELDYIDTRLNAITPANGYGPVFDQEREELAARRRELLEQQRAAQAPTVTQPAPAGDAPVAGAETTRPTQVAPTDFWSFAKSKGYKPGDIKVGTPEHAALKAEYDALRQGQTAERLPVEPLNNLPDPALQNRDRSRAASVVQMSEIARNPDYLRLGPSRTPDSGAPMVFAVGDDVSRIPAENFGRQDVAVMSDGQRVPFRYAVVDATKVNPSNFADGRLNPEFSSTTPGTIKALNNGRAAGVRAAHEMGTAGEYVAGMQADEAMHGIPADVIARTPNPMLVRVYSDAANTANMAAKSQGQGLGMSPAELARQDAPLMDSSVLGVYEPGEIASAANRDFVRAFIGKLQAAGQDVAGMMTGDGQLSQDGRKRIQAALMQAAYGDSDIVEEMFDSTDTDIKAIGEALKTLAGQWANMRDSAKLGAINPQTDITQNLIQAIGLIRKARRDGTMLYDLVNQPDLMTGETPDATTVGVLRMFYSGQYMTRAVGKDKLTKSLSDYVTAAMATSADPGMFGDVVTAGEILATINPITEGQSDAEAQPEEGRGQPAGSGDPGVGAGEARTAVGRQRAGESGPGATADRGSEPGQDAAPEAQQQVGQGDPRAEEGDGAAAARAGAGQQEGADGRAAAAEGRAGAADGQAVKAKKPKKAAKPKAEPDALPADQVQQLERDFRAFPTQILNNLLERGEAAKLYKAAGVKGASAFGDLAMDDKAAAYVKFVQQGGKPVENLPKDYNAWVKSEERAAEVRRLQSDRVVRQENGKPFKSKTSAQQYQERYDLTGTHEVVAVDGGFELRQLSPAAQAELKRKAEGRESYTEAQAAVAEEMGIGQTPDGEWDATDDQFDEMERRVQARMRGEPAEPLLTNPTREDVLAQQERAENAQAADEREQIRRESEAGAGTFSLEMQDGRQDTTADLFRQTAAEPAAEPAPAEEPARPQKSEAKGKNEDVGEQLYANRRNFTGRGIKWEDVEGLNDTLKVKEVTKAKVWPRPDYEKLVADGMPAVLARMVKHVYDGLSAGPTISGTSAPTDADLKRYIDTLTKVREALFSFISDRQQAAKFAQDVLTLVKGERTGLGPVSILDMSKQAEGAKELQQVLLRRVWPDEMAKPVAGRFRRGSDANQEAGIIGGNKALAAMQFGRSDLSKWVADLGKGWPAKREAWQVQGYQVLAPGEYTVAGQEQEDGTYRMSILPKQGRGSWRAVFTDTQMAEQPFVLVQDGGFTAEAFPTREAAIEAAREKVKRGPGAGQDIRGTNIEESERTGPERRQDGEDISSQRLMDTFGFRGVNFGREGWINQAERQEYLNQAYDGLMDLAEVLGVPPKAMSLDGKLGIAFGAQGKGKFAAHFVPGVNEINLTKTRGAGTLAHEWGHALDHHFGLQAGLAKDEAPFLSEHVHKGDTTSRVVFQGGKYVNQKNVLTFGEGIRPEIVRAFRAIYQAMEKRDESPGEAAARRDAAKTSALKRLDGWIKAARRAIEASAADNKADLLAEFDQHAEKLREGDTGDGYAKAGQQVFSARVAAIRNLIKDATGRLWSKDETQGLDSAASYVRSLIGKEEADATHQPQKVSTQYKADSLAMDREKGGKAYWSTPAEMFARAFELYVHDKLSQRGQRNTFLTDAEQRASRPIQIPDSSSAMSRGAGAMRDLYVYPVGKERETIREAFDNLVGEIKTRETEQGVTLFSRSPEFYAEVDRAIDAGLRDDKQALRQQIDVGIRTPEVLRMLGVDDKPVYTNRNLIAKMHLEHGVPKAQLRDLAGLLENPALVFESDTRPGRLLLVTEAVVNGSPVVVAVEPNGSSGRLEVVYLPSMYPRNDAQWKFPQWIRAGKLKYADKSRSRLLATTAGLQLPGVVQRSVGFTPAKYMTESDRPQAGLSRGRAGGMTESAVRQVADTITSRWAQAPTVVVVPNMQDMRVPEAARQEDARQRAAGATGVPRAFYDRGTVYLVADGLRSISDAAEALFHEALGHYGLRAVFGPGLVKVLDDLAAARPDLLRAKAKEYGKDLGSQKERRQVAEEVLAEMAQTKPNLGFVKRAIAAIRTWLRQNVPYFKDLALTDAEIINSFILPARGWVERGERAMRPGGQIALSRSAMKSVTANIDRGLAALAKAVNEKTTVHRAMFRNGLGWVDFVWGDEGRVKPSGKTAGGKGLSHIVEARMRKDGLNEAQAVNVLSELVRTIAAGEEFDRKEVDRAVRVGIRHDGYIAWLAKQPGANAWVVTGYEVDPDRAAAGRATAALTTSAASRTRDGEGAGSGGIIAPGADAGNTMLSRSTLGNTPPTPPQNPNAWQKLKAKVLELTSPDAIESLIYEYQDKNIDLKRLRDHIKELGGTITDLNDAYLGEELYHKRLAKRMQDFLSEELKPLLADMRARGVDMPTLERYLHARHAPEANRVLAERNPNAQMIEAGKAKARAEVKALEVQLQRARAQGAATKAIEQALEQALAELDRWTGAQAFKGTEAERLSLSGMSDAEAAAFMGGLPAGQKVHLEALAARVDAMQAKTLEALEKYGLMDKATLDAWRSTYQFYVPLHRDEAHPDAVSHPIGQGFSTKGDASKRRTGSNEKVTNILAHIAMQREAALTRGEKNRVAKKLYLMAAQNPDPEIWSVDKPPMMKTVDRETGFVRTTVDPTYRNKPNVVMVRIGGKDHAITFNERNPKAVRMAQSIKGADVGDLNAFESIMGKATRWLASVNTQYNPIFGIINFARDVQAAILQLSTTPLKGQERAVAAYVPAALKGIYAEVRSRRKGQPRGTGQWAKLWEDMQDEGGTTGYRELFITPDERVKALTKELNALERGKVSEAAHAVVDWLSDYNETMENAVRLAAYKVALDQGMSKERAASLAKNLTVNFNRRGRQTARLGAYYAFLNAAIQGTTRMVETLRGPLGRKIMLGGVMLGAVNALIGMAMMGGDDGEEDNWEKIPDFVKERSLIIPLGREDYLAIPMPLGYHVFPNLGRKAVEMMMHDDPTKGVGSHIAEMLRITLDAFNPLGGSENLAQMVTPTPFDPAVALMMNRDWTGKPIYREDNSNLDPTPGHQRTKDTASAFSKAVSEALNKITGGTDYQPGAVSVTPDQIDYVIGQITGGLGREILKLENTITAPLTGDELPAYKIPLVGRLYGNTRGPANNAELFYEHVRELNKIENEIRGRARDGGDVAGYMAEEPLSALVGMGNAAENQIRKLSQYRAEVVRRAAPGYQDEVKRINEQMGEVMKLLNQEVRRAKMEAAAAQ